MMKSVKLILFSALMIVLSVVLLKNLQEAQTATDSLDFEIAATCSPHSEIKLPESLQLQYGFVGSVQGSAVDSMLKAGTEDYEQVDFKFGLPERGWVSLVFSGPRVEAKLYCQSLAERSSFYLSGDRLSHMKIYLSRDGQFSEEELASSDSFKKNELQVIGSGHYKNEFLFGKNSINPYWLQFAIPMSQNLSFASHLNFEVR